jgi:hypothetical protein
MFQYEGNKITGGEYASKNSNNNLNFIQLYGLNKTFDVSPLEFYYLEQSINSWDFQSINVNLIINSRWFKEVYPHRDFPQIFVNKYTKDKKIIYLVKFVNDKSVISHRVFFYPNIKKEIMGYMNAVDFNTKNMVRSFIQKITKKNSKKNIDYNLVETFDFIKFLSKNKYYISPKRDGITCVLCIINYNLYHVTKTHIRLLQGNLTNTTDNLLIICEYLENNNKNNDKNNDKNNNKNNDKNNNKNNDKNNDTYVMLDILSYGDKRFLNKPFKKRLEFMKKNINKLKKMSINLEMQMYEKLDNYQKKLTYMKKLLNNKNGIIHGEIDGIIFQSSGKGYYDELVLKWKDSKNLTIDLLTIEKELKSENKENNNKQNKNVTENFKTFCNNRGHLNNVSSILSDINIKHSANMIKNNKCFIGEYNIFIINENSKKHVCLSLNRIRNDKDKPNGCDYLKKYVDMVSYQDWDYILGNSPHMMRRYLRKYQKDNLITKIPNNMKLFDLGAGDGRLMREWRSKYLDVVALEPNKENFEKLKTRNENSVNMYFQDPKIQKMFKKHTFDIIYLSYSLTFFFENDKILQQFVDNISHLLADGGQVIGIGMDGQELKKEMKKRGVREIDTKALNIHFIENKVVENNKQKRKDNIIYDRENSEKISITIKNNYTLVDGQVEPLTNFSKLVQMLKKKNIKLKQTGFVPTNNLFGPDMEWFIRITRWFIFKKKISS